MKRLLTAAIGVPAALFAVFRFPEWAFLLLLLVVFEWAALEFLAMVRPLAPQAPWRLLLLTLPLAAVALERGLAQGAPLDAGLAWRPGSASTARRKALPRASKFSN